MSMDGPFFGPCLNPGGGEQEWTDEQVEQFKAEWRRKYKPREIRLLTPLPRRVRLRLAAEQAITRAGTWLCDHRMWRAAELLWKVLG
jgi:hypothetical protein